MPTVTIAGNDFEVMADIAEHDIFLSADINQSAVWSSYDADYKAQAAVGAFRLFSRLDWIGGRVNAEQAGPFPRSGLPGDEAFPEAIKHAAILLAAEGAATPAVFTQANTGSNVRTVRAGSVSLTNFRPEDGFLVPFNVMVLVSPYLTSSVSMNYPAPCGCGSERATTSDSFDRFTYPT